MKSQVRNVSIWLQHINNRQFEILKCNVTQVCSFLSLQQQLNTSFDDETASLLHDCYTLEDKERLKEEWRLFEEQKKNFERERKNFTEAAIRLGREVLQPLFNAVALFYSCIMGVVVALHSFESFFLPFHRKKPFKKTVLLGSRINFWTWLPSQTEGDVLRLTDKVPYQSVSLFCCCSCCFHKYFPQQ